MATAIGIRKFHLCFRAPNMNTQHFFSVKPSSFLMMLYVATPLYQGINNLKMKPQQVKFLTVTMMNNLLKHRILCKNLFLS